MAKKWGICSIPHVETNPHGCTYVYLVGLSSIDGAMGMFGCLSFIKIHPQAGHITKGMGLENSQHVSWGNGRVHLIVCLFIV